MNENEYLEAFYNAKYLVSLGNYQSYYYKTDSRSSETVGNGKRDELCEALENVSDYNLNNDEFNFYLNISNHTVYSPYVPMYHTRLVV